MPVINTSGFIVSQLGQLRPANTTAVSIFSPRAKVLVQVVSLLVCNTTGTAATFRIFHDDDGTTYDETTSLFFDESCPANQTRKVIEEDVWMSNSSGNIAVATGTNSALTFTLYGRIYDFRPL